MIIDTFCFFNELDLLEARLNILDPYVDFFVICEGKETFSGKEKKLNYLENKERFCKFRNKIIYINPSRIKTDDAFERAFHQKEYIKKQLWKFCKDDDIIYFGDLDEIWKPQDIQDDKVYNLEQLNYAYWLNNRSSERWVGTIVGKWSSIMKNTLSHWRATHTNVIKDGGWHFTNMGGADQIRHKLEAYDHQENNLDHIKQDIEFSMNQGLDYVGRKTDWEGKPFSFWLDESELPKYILENKIKYSNYFK